MDWSICRYFAAVFGVMLVVWSPGCDDGYKPVEHPDGDQAWEIAHSVQFEEEDVMATVDGHPILRSDVEAKWRDMPEATVSEVVDELVERQVLAQQARRQGYHERPEVAFSRKQGLVSALLLETVEEQAEVDESQRQSLTDYVEATRRVPEGLRASHLVILVPEEIEDDGQAVELDSQQRDAKYERAREALGEAQQLLDGRVDDHALREVATQLNEEFLDGHLEAVVNEHMRFPRAQASYQPEHLPRGWVSVVSEFAQGAEEVAEDGQRGQLSQPVRTDFGWHLIRVDEVFEERGVEPDALRNFVDYELQRRAREARLHELVEQWADGVPAQVHPDRLRSVLDE